MLIKTIILLQRFILEFKQCYSKSHAFIAFRGDSNALISSDFKPQLNHS